MRRGTFTSLTIATALVSIAAPITIAILQARRQGLDLEGRRAVAYAVDVLRRTDATAAQIDAGLSAVTALAPAAPCSERGLAAMRQVDIGSSLVQALGYVVDGNLVCSSFGRHKKPVPLGRVDLTTRWGERIRTNVEFPFVPGVRFIVVQRGPYAAIVHKDLPIDATILEQGVVVGSYFGGSAGILAKRGALRSAWVDTPHDTTGTTFVDNGFVVAVIGSSRFATGAVAAIPIGHVNERVRASAMVLIPIGVVAGLILAAAVLRLAKWHRSMPSVIRAALRRNEFTVVYEPIVDLPTGRWIGAEALIRWRRSNGQMVRPDLFIPVAEEAGLIEQITECVVRIVERETAELFRAFPGFRVAINLSATDLHSQRSVELLREVVHNLGVAPGQLIVEISERGVLRTDIARPVIHDLRKAGLTVAIDDFGTGYSCLSYLESLELDVLKIDKSFVDSIGTKGATSQVALHIIAMAQALDLTLVAEGVETHTQLEFLREHGVEMAQGYLFSRPLTLDGLLSHLRAMNEDSAGRWNREVA